MRPMRALLVALVMVAASAPAFGWSRDGHRLSCAIALDVISPSTRAAAFEILEIDRSEQFLDLCSWADRVKATQPETAPWHSMLLPRGATSIDVARDCPEPKSCVLNRVVQEISTLKSDAPRDQKATALKLLMHLIADLHQPLNLGFADDEGGKKIAATFLGQPSTLHEIWETKLLEADRAAPDSAHETLWLAHEVQTHPAPLDWARESFFIMRSPATGYIGNPGGLPFDERYVQQNRPIAMGQLEKAGVRLGLTLNDALR